MKEERIQKHKKFASSLQDKLKDVDGVESVELDDRSPETAYTAQIVVWLQARRIDRPGEAYDLEGNLRSISQKLRHAVKECGSDDILGEVVVRPYKRYEYNSFSGSMEPYGYNRDYYTVDTEVFVL